MNAHFTTNRRGIGFVVVVVLFVGGWRLWTHVRASHLLAIAKEIGSVAQFKSSLFPNSAGTSLVYVQETETGLGTYFLDIASGEKKLLFEQTEKGFDFHFGFLGWAPDCGHFACLVLTDPDPKRLKKEIILYDGNSGEITFRFPADSFLWFSQFAWLSPSSFVYTTYNNALVEVSRGPNGDWTQLPAHKVPRMYAKDIAEDAMKNLTATSPHSVAWQVGGDIWTLDLVNDSADKIWESTTNHLESFTYSEDTDEYLLTLNDESVQHTVFFRAASKRFPEVFFREVAPDDKRTPYADLSEVQAQYVFNLKANASAEAMRWVWPGMLENYKVGGNCLFFTGNKAGEPCGIYRYNPASQEEVLLVSDLQHPLKSTKLVVPSSRSETNDTGRKLNFHIWEPLHVSEGKKYPLIVGQMHYMWYSYPQVAATAGYYFASADRISWWDGIENWAQDVIELREILSKNPNIDTNRIFLLGTSAETAYLNHVVMEKPGWWKGVILFDPDVLPHLSDSRLSSMFIVSGKDDDRQFERLTKYQDEAAQSGIPVKLIMQEGCQHITRSIATERERNVEFAKFLLEN